jgi:hypothetical protein
MSERLDILKPILDRYKRRFTVLDIGCGPKGLLSREIAEKYDAAVFGVDREMEGRWPDSTAVQLNGDVSPDMLEAISRCEHFDVVLAMNLLHHYAESDWERALKTICGMGDLVFIQMPPKGTERVAGQPWLDKMIDAIDARCIGIGEAYYEPFDHERRIWGCVNHGPRSFPGHTIRGRSPKIHKNDKPNPWRVWSSPGVIYAEKAAGIMRDSQMKSWIPGMNLWNLCQFEMVSPTREEFASMVRAYPLPDHPHGDIIAWNFVYDGRELHLIDFGEMIRDDAEGREHAARMVEGRE